MLSQQVNKQHYNFSSYLYKGRFISYWHQIDEVLRCSPESVLVIGPGDDIITHILHQYVAIVKTFDISSELSPDYLGSVTHLTEIVDKHFDCVLCCQVLEHIPLEMVSSVLCQLCEVGGTVIISVPYNAYFSMVLSFGCTFVKARSLIIRIPSFLKRWDFQRDGNNEHYWEMGCHKCSRKSFEKMLSKHGDIVKTYSDPSNIYHFFFIIKSKMICM